MVRSRPQQSVPACKTKKGSLGGTQMDQQCEEGWIMVKKQKVTILIPPLPARKQSVVHNTGQSLLHVPAFTPNTRQDQVEDILTEPHVNEGDESKSPAPELIRSTLPQEVPQSFSQFSSPSRLHNREGLKSQPKPSFRTGRTIGVCSASGITNRSVLIAGKATMINKRIRAMNLERKLQSAGGLRTWLVSRGFGHFVTLFQSENINKYQLANLTMERLKEMGSHAVGPRRKLIHAIDCLCQPYYLEHS